MRSAFVSRSAWRGLSSILSLPGSNQALAEGLYHQLSSRGFVTEEPPSTIAIDRSGLYHAPVQESLQIKKEPESPLVKQLKALIQVQLL